MRMRARAHTHTHTLVHTHTFSLSLSLSLSAESVKLSGTHISRCQGKQAPPSVPPPSSSSSQGRQQGPQLQAPTPLALAALNELSQAYVNQDSASSTAGLPTPSLPTMSGSCTASESAPEGLGGRGAAWLAMAQPPSAPLLALPGAVDVVWGAGGGAALLAERDAFDASVPEDAAAAAVLLDRCSDVKVRGGAVTHCP